MWHPGNRVILALLKGLLQHLLVLLLRPLPAQNSTDWVAETTKSMILSSVDDSESKKKYVNNHEYHVKVL